MGDSKKQPLLLIDLGDAKGHSRCMLHMKPEALVSPKHFFRSGVSPKHIRVECRSAAASARLAAVAISLDWKRRSRFSAQTPLPSLQSRFDALRMFYEEKEVKPPEDMLNALRMGWSVSRGAGLGSAVDLYVDDRVLDLSDNRVETLQTLFFARTQNGIFESRVNSKWLKIKDEDIQIKGMQHLLRRLKAFVDRTESANQQKERPPSISESRTKIESQGRGREIVEAPPHQDAFTTVLLKKHAHIIGRESHKKSILSFIKNNPSGLIRITGKPGMGKTALLAHLASGEARAICHKKTAGAFFFREESGSSTGRVCLQTLMKYLGQKYSLMIGEPHDEADKLASQFENCLAEVSSCLGSLKSEKSRREVLFLDAMDAAQDAREAAAMLPSFLPNGVFLVVSFREGHPLKSLRPADRTTPLLDLSLRPDKENESDAQQFLEDRFPDWSAETVGEVSKVAQGNFLVLDILSRLCESACSEPDAIRIATRIGRRRGDLLFSAYSQFWSSLRDRTRRDSTSAWEDITTVLGLLAIARDALGAAQVGVYAGDWGYGRIDRAIEPIREFLLEDESRIPNETAYSIYHDTFRAFVREEMRGHLAQLHQHIADRVLSVSSNGRTPQSLDPYALRYGAEHVANSVHPERCQTFLSPEFVRHKMIAMGSMAPVMDDLDAAIKGCAEKEHHVAAMALGMAKLHFSINNPTRFTGIQSILRVRMGDKETAEAIVENYGSAEDRVLAYAEMLSRYPNDIQQVARLRDRLLIAARQVSPITAEVAAERLAPVHPDIALHLARSIEEPSSLLNPDSGEENVTSARCMSRVFRRIAAASPAQAGAIIPQLSNIYEKALSLVAVGDALWCTDTKQSVKAIKRGLRFLGDRELASHVLTLYIDRKMRHTDPVDGLSALSAAGVCFRLLPNHLVSPEAFDRLVICAPGDCLSLAERTKSTAIRSLLCWRLAESKHISRDKFMAMVENSLIKDIFLSRDASKEFKGTNKTRLQVFKSLQCSHWHSQEVVSAISRINGAAANDVVRLLKETASTLEKMPPLARLNVFTELTRCQNAPISSLRSCLANCFLTTLEQWPDQKLFERANSAFTEYQKKFSSIHSLLFPSIKLLFLNDFESESWCAFVMRQLIKYGGRNTAEALAASAPNSSTSSQSLRKKIPCKKGSSESELALLLIAAQHQAYDSHLARKLLIKASRLVCSIKDKAERQSSFFALFKISVFVSPNFARALLDNSLMNVDVFVSGTRMALLKKVMMLDNDEKDGDLGAVLLRLLIERSLKPADDVRGDRRWAFIYERDNAIANWIVPFVNSELDSIEKTTTTWVDQLFCLIEEFADRFDSVSRTNQDRFQIYELSKLCSLLTELDLGALRRNILRNKSAHDCLKGSLAQADIQRLVALSFKDDPQSLWADLKCLFDEFSTAQEANAIETTSTYRIILAAAAAYAPDLCIQLTRLIKSLDRPLTSDYTTRFTPETHWRPAMTVELFELICAMFRKESSRANEAATLTWYGTRMHNPRRFIELAVARALTYTKIEDVLLIATSFHALHPSSVTQLFERALQLYSASDVDDEILKAIPFTYKQSHARARDILLDVASRHKETPESSVLSDVAFLQSRYFPDQLADMLSTIFRFKAEHRERIVKAIGEGMAIRTLPEYSEWHKRIISIAPIDNQDRLSLFRYLLHKATNANIEIDLDDIPHPLTKAISGSVYEGQALLRKGKEQHALFVLAARAANKEPLTFSGHDIQISVAKHLADSDARLAASILKERSTQAMKQLRPFGVAIDTMLLSSACDELPLDLAKAASTLLYTHSIPSTSLRRLPQDDDARARALMQTVPLFWRHDPGRAREVLKEAVDAFVCEVRPSTNSVWNLDVRIVAIRLYVMHGTPATRELFILLRRFLPLKMRYEVLDQILMACTLYAKQQQTAPFVDYGIDQKKLSPEELGVLKVLLPLCSPSAQVKGQIAIAVSEFVSDLNTGRLAAEEAIMTLRSLTRPISDEDHDTAWFLYLLTHGSDVLSLASQNLLARKDELPLSDTKVFKPCRTFDRKMTWWIACLIYVKKDSVKECLQQLCNCLKCTIQYR